MSTSPEQKNQKKAAQQKTVGQRPQVIHHQPRDVQSHVMTVCAMSISQCLNLKNIYIYILIIHINVYIYTYECMTIKTHVMGTYICIYIYTGI